MNVSAAHICSVNGPLLAFLLCTYKVYIMLKGRFEYSVEPKSSTYCGLCPSFGYSPFITNPCDQHLQYTK